MKVTVTYACGHQEEIAVFGKRAERERKIAWLEAQVCVECRVAKAAEASKATGMAALTGSPKQVAWAEDLRSETMGAIAATKTRTESESALKDRVIKYVGGITSAAWWIDNRFFVGKGMILCAVAHAKENSIDLTAETVEETVE